MSYPYLDGPWIRRDRWVEAQDLCCRFCDVNGLPTPRFEDRTNRIHYGLYQPRTKTVSVAVDKTRPPSRTAFSWTWPGYKADLTVLGVTAHELGHHWHFLTGERAVIRDFRLIGELPLTSYEPNTSEAIAESFKVFVTNPDLLRVLRPARYEFFRARLTPVIDLEWHEVLDGSPRHVLAVLRKLSTKSRK
jgi:hypothetical protein